MRKIHLQRDIGRIFEVLKKEDIKLSELEIDFEDTQVSTDEDYKEEMRFFKCFGEIFKKNQEGLQKVKLNFSRSKMMYTQQIENFLNVFTEISQLTKLTDLEINMFGFWINPER